MIGLLCFVLAVLASPFKSKVRLEAENAVLRHQLNVLRRRRPGRVRLTTYDRWFFTSLYEALPCQEVFSRSTFFFLSVSRGSLQSAVLHCIDGTAFPPLLG